MKTFLNYNFTEKTNIIIFSKDTFYKDGFYNFTTVQKVVLTDNIKQTKKDFIAAGFNFDSSLKYCKTYKGINMEIWKDNKNKYCSILHTNFILNAAIEKNLLKTY